MRFIIQPNCIFLISPSNQIGPMGHKLLPSQATVHGGVIERFVARAGRTGVKQLSLCVCPVQLCV